MAILYKKIAGFGKTAIFHTQQRKRFLKKRIE
jgi:hypothetical protein